MLRPWYGSASVGENGSETWGSAHAKGTGARGEFCVPAGLLHSLWSEFLSRAELETIVGSAPLAATGRSSQIGPPGLPPPMSTRGS